MAKQQVKMKCPDCGAEMNFHAEKLDQSRTTRSSVDKELGGVLEEFHTCPECRKTHSRDSQEAGR